MKIDTKPFSLGRLEILIPILIGLLASLFLTGWQIIDPKNTDWLMRGDPATNYLGWGFFRHTPLTQWPIGANLGYGLGFSNSIVNTGSITLFAYFFKLFNPILPQIFQYFGIWLLLCFILQSVFSWKLLRLFINNKSHLIIGTLFFSFSPILLYRISIGNSGHFDLAAHWLILAALFLYFRSESLDWHWPVLICVSVLVQPYLFAMVLVIWFTALIRLFSKKLLNKVLLAKHILIVILLIFLVMWASGYFMFNSVGVSSGYEQFRWTLSSPIDPSLPGGFEWSRVLEDLPQLSGDAEGFSYLGSGIILLFLLLLVTKLKQYYLRFKESKLLSAVFLFLSASLLGSALLMDIWPSIRLFISAIVFGSLILFVFGIYVEVIDFHRLRRSIRDQRFLILLATIMMAVYALSSRPGFGSFVFFEYPVNFFYKYITQSFRVGGRFIWPAIYLFVLYVIVKVNRKFSAKVASLVLTICFSVQAFDSYGALQTVNHRFTQVKTWNPEPQIDPAWEKILLGKTKLLVVSESKTYDYGNWILVADFASKNKLATNTGYFARIDNESFLSFEAKLFDQASNGELSADSVYIIDQEDVWQKLLAKSKTFRFIGILDGFKVVSP